MSATPWRWPSWWPPDPIGDHYRQLVLRRVLIALIVLLGTNAAIRLAQDPDYVPPWPGYLVLLGALWLNRVGLVRLAAVVTVALPPAFLAATFLLGEPVRPPIVVIYLLLDLILASILLGGAAIAILGAVNLALLLTFHRVVPSFATSGVFTASLMLFVISTVLLMFGLRVRRRVEEERDAALVDANARMAVMLQSAMDAVIMVDAAGAVVEVNPAAERIFGFSRDAMLGREMASLIIPEDQRAAHRSGIARAVASGSGALLGQRLEMRALRSDGTTFPCELSIAMARLPSGIMFTGFVRDLSEREAASARHDALMEQLQQSQKMQAIGQLAGGVAHEFNNMLQVITGFLSMAIDDLRGRAPDAVKDLTQATETALRASDLTRRLLAFSRRQVLRLDVVDLNEALAASLTLVRRALGEQIRLEFHPGEALPTVRLDRSQLEQVVLNLCLNARDAMPDGGLLLIETELVDVPESLVADLPWATAGTYVALVVADNGVGMTPEVAARVFEPFFTTRELRGGTGLGLAVVYGIVEQHKGFIRIDSAPGQGTSFRLYWPISGEEATPRVVLDDAPVARGTETVLVAEDADAIRTLIARTLTGAGYRVITARNGREAVDRHAQADTHIDMAVLDMVMPGLSGRGALEQMRQRQPDLPCLFLSGYSASEVTAQWLEDQRCAIILKPVSTHDLLREVRMTLDARSVGGAV